MDSVLAWGYPGIFICGFLAGSIIPMNVEAAVTAALALGWPSWPCFLAAWLGDWFGSSTNYLIGRCATLEWIEKYARIKREKLEKAQRFMNGKGIWLAALNFLPSIGNAIVISFGVARAPFWKICTIICVSVFVRLLIWMLITNGILAIF